MRNSCVRFAAFAAPAIAAAVVTTGAARTLDFYFIDVEGGQSTLIVTPAGETLLVDAGFPGSGTFASKPSEPAQARDPRRIVAAARQAGVSKIDYLLVTHFHGDHVGGVMELSRELPIGTFVDHGTVPPEAENVAGTLALFDLYSAVRAKGRHLEPKPGDRLPLKGVDAVVVSAARATLAAPLSGAGEETAQCDAAPIPAQEVNENPRSTGFRLRFGRFTFLDLGDLTGPPLAALVCPRDLIGAVDVYLVAHHGGLDAAVPATFAAFRPRVAVVNNGARKGGSPEMFPALRSSPGLEDAWQLHRSRNEGAENYPDARLANLDESTAHWIKASANEDGSFSVTNGRTGETKNYPARRR